MKCPTKQLVPAMNLVSRNNERSSTRGGEHGIWKAPVEAESRWPGQGTPGQYCRTAQSLSRKPAAGIPTGRVYHKYLTSSANAMGYGWRVCFVLPASILVAL